MRKLPFPEAWHVMLSRMEQTIKSHAKPQTSSCRDFATIKLPTMQMEQLEWIHCQTFGTTDIPEACSLSF
jgi:hypothetical protein